MRYRATQKQLAELAETTEVAAWTDFVRAAPPDVVAACGIDLREDDGAVASIAPGLDVLMLNRVIGLGIQRPLKESSLDAFLAAFRDAGVRRYFVQLSPSALPTDAADLLRERGLSHYNNWSKIYYRRQPTTPPRVASDLAVERIGPERAADFARIARAGFDWPLAAEPWLAAAVGRDGWRHYIASEDGKPVATGALFIHDDVGWLGFAATDPSFRRRGAQSSLIARRMQDAIEAGCRTLVGESAEDRPGRPSASFRNLRRLGWELLYLRPNYANVPAPTS